MKETKKWHISEIDLTPTLTLTLLFEILYQITNGEWYRIGTWVFGIMFVIGLILVFLISIDEYNKKGGK